MKPELLNGGNHEDWRGIIRFNNDFDSSSVRRIYTIENLEVLFIRGWQGHKVEQRWFTVMQGAFKIVVIAICDWDNTSKKVDKKTFIIDAEQFDVLYVPKGCVTSIQALSLGSKLLAMSDYRLNEINDEHRFPLDYFE